jgi:hypothetical protein
MSYAAPALYSCPGNWRKRRMAVGCCPIIDQKLTRFPAQLIPKLIPLSEGYPYALYQMRLAKLEGPAMAATTPKYGSDKSVGKGSSDLDLEPPVHPPLRTPYYGLIYL